MSITYPTKYQFRAFRYENKYQPDAPAVADSEHLDEGDDRWNATLYREGTRIGEVVSENRYGPAQITFLNPSDQALFDVELQACIPADSTLSKQDHLNQWMLWLAEQAYHVRRLQLKTKDNTLFKLCGDPPEVYHMIRGQSYTLDIEGKLRIMYGQQLQYVVHPDNIPLIVHENYGINGAIG